MNKRIISIGLSVLMACPAISAASIVPDSLLVQEIEAPFRLLEAERVPTGILTEYGVHMVDLDYYNGELTDDNYVNWSTLVGILEGIQSSRIYGQSSLSVDDVTEAMSTQFRINLNPTGLAVYRVNNFKEMTENDRLVEYDPTIGLIQDKYESGTWVNPYDESYVVAFSPYMNVTKRTVSYHFSSDYRFSNVSISSILFNPGDGGGDRTISLNQPQTITVTYPATTAERTLVLKITLSDGTQLYSHSKVQVIVPEDEIPQTLTIDYTQTFTASQAYSGYLPTATVFVKYATGRSTLQNPFIVAEGFDPLSDPLGLIGNAPGYGAQCWWGLYEDWPTDYKSQYDLVYIDWKMSVAPIEANADILRQVIQWVNQNKTTTNKNVVMGQSMGGLVARYALCAMEQDGVPHDTQTYISDDAPHLGVNVPLGFVYLAQHLYDKVDNSTARFFKDLIISVYRLFNSSAPSMTDVNKYYDELMALRNSPSVRQMMIDYVNSSKQWDASMHTAFLADMRTLGFPQGDSGCPILNLCVSNGGVNDFSVEFDSLLEASLHYESGLIQDLLSGLIGIVWAKKRGIPSFFGVLCAGHTTIDAYCNVYPFYENGATVLDALGRYKRKILWLIPVYHTLFSYHNQAPATGCPLDDLYGSYYSLNTKYGNTGNGGSPYLLGEYEFSLEYKKNFLFVPTMSSLYYGKGNIAINMQDGKKDFRNQGVEWSQIPFDGYYFSAGATMHVDVSDSLLWHWAGRMQDLNLEPVVDETDSLLIPFLSRYATEFEIVDTNPGGPSFTVTWSTSDTAIATVSQNGVITPVSNGAAYIYADIACLGGKMRLSRPIQTTGVVIPPEPDFPGFPNFVLSVEAEPIFPGSTYPDPVSYTVMAAAQSQVDTVFSNHFVCKWGVRENTADSITWTSRPYNSHFWLNSFFCEFPSTATARRVYFKVEYNGQSSPTYSIRCLQPLMPVLLDGEGFIYSGEDQGEAFAQVKGTLEENFLVTCMEQEMQFNHFPSSREICLRMLSNPDFVAAIKRARPWGNENAVLIPIAYRKEEDVEFTEDLLTFVFDETL